MRACSKGSNFIASNESRHPKLLEIIGTKLSIVFCRVKDKMWSIFTETIKCWRTPRNIVFLNALALYKHLGPRRLEIAALCLPTEQQGSNRLLFFGQKCNKTPETARLVNDSPLFYSRKNMRQTVFAASRGGYLQQLWGHHSALLSAMYNYVDFSRGLAEELMPLKMYLNFFHS